LNSDEIKILITALGTGIGKEDFNLEKLRYHKIVIMTDADVDGSHIMTLILTFFFRQMPEIIEKGYLYIAQPPLYKVKRGKAEEYVENEEKLMTMLFDFSVGKFRLVNGEETKLADFAASVVRLNRMLDRLTHNSTLKIVYHLLFQYQVKLEKIDIQTIYHEFDRIGREHPDRQLSVSLDPNGQEMELNLNDKTYQVPEPLLRIIDIHNYNRVLSQFEALEKLKHNGQFQLLDEANSPLTFSTAGEVVDFLQQDARKGVYIQRYKGLGEMNPEQLWETTMNPEKRMMLQVSVEDAIEADRVFTILMGDQVDVRRDYIVENALKVKNLDL